MVCAELSRDTDWIAGNGWRTGHRNWRCCHAVAKQSCQAESVLDVAVMRAQDEALWRLDDAESLLLRRVLKLQDDQLGGVSTRVFLQAQAKLAALLRRTKPESPIKREMTQRARHNG
ncbi:hypothetical protein DLM46_33080 [Paraburkholderia lacunae]|uniref:Uncharacterized protein n=1 Tax=Paraburkholderia lacunae TaxID=2211104 RepID=A0A370MZE1_9BURK|nr:hypothetical protein DLM46_33080 [Paraburkholderia lacunae]